MATKPQGLGRVQKHPLGLCYTNGVALFFFFQNIPENQVDCVCDLTKMGENFPAERPYPYCMERLKMDAAYLAKLGSGEPFEIPQFTRYKMKKPVPVQWSIKTEQVATKSIKKSLGWCTYDKGTPEKFITTMAKPPKKVTASGKLDTRYKPLWDMITAKAKGAELVNVKLLPSTQTPYVPFMSVAVVEGTGWIYLQTFLEDGSKYQ